MKTTLTLAPGAVIEPVGEDVMVMMPGNTDILRISGPAADTLRTIVAGQPVDPSTSTVLELANQGIIFPSGMSRRGLIRAGAIGAGAGIAVLAMPTAAMAASSAPTVSGTWLSIGFQTWAFRVDSGGFPAADDTLTLAGTDNFGVSPGTQWSSTDDGRFGPLQEQDITGTFVDSSTGDVYNVTFLWVAV
jgi:transcription elongation factor